MARQMEKVQQEEHRTRSELLREAWGQYFESRYASYTLTKSELAAIAKGRADFKQGKFITLDQLHNALDSARRQARKKRPRKTS